MINSQDISVVVQGAIDKKETKKCLKSIRKFLPDAEIILSTWDGENVSELEKYCNVILKNTDPGTQICDLFYNTYNNINRQLVSTQEGIKNATQKYILKLRTDSVLKNSNFLRFYNIFEKSDKKYNVFSNRIIASSLFTREYSDLNNMPTPFHLGDLYFFGEKTDIENLFLTTPLMVQSDMSSYNFKYNDKKPYPSISCRYLPEQYICSEFFKQYFKFKFDDSTDWNNENVQLSLIILINNFIILDSFQSGIYTEKFNHFQNYTVNIKGLITFDKFVKYYKHYCDSNFCLKKDILYKIKLKKHIETFFKPIKKICSWSSNLFSILYYAIKLLTLNKNN